MSRPFPVGRVGVPEYAAMVARVRELMARALPPDCEVLVVSRGDDALLGDEQRRGRHFPQEPDGTYAGFHPADDAAAVAHLEALRERGAAYLVVPATAFWWFEHYPGFWQHLNATYRLGAFEEDSCAMFSLREAPVATHAPAAPVSGMEAALAEIASSLLPDDAQILVAGEEAPAMLVRFGERARGLLADGDASADAPADSHAAVDALARAIDEGAHYLLIPNSGRGVLRRYPGLAQHLQDRHRVVMSQRHAGTVFELRAPSERRADLESETEGGA